MAGSGLLRERDLRALTAVVQDGLADDPGPVIPWAVLYRLHDLIPADGVVFDDDDLRNRTAGDCQILNEGEGRFTALGPEPASTPEVWAHRERFLPYSYTYSAPAGERVSVRRWSDFYTQTELKNQPFYDLIRQDIPIRYGIIMPLPAPAGWHRRIALFRMNRDFTERDRLVLQLLRPHVHELYLDAEGRRRGVPYLTRREREILQLVSLGYSNADIAGRLFISVATVRKHMENIFNRTGVRTRGGAAALALPQTRLIGSLPVNPG